jgi:hypothetical protein
MRRAPGPRPRIAWVRERGAASLSRWPSSSAGFPNGCPKSILYLNTTLLDGGQGLMYAGGGLRQAATAYRLPPSSRQRNHDQREVEGS